IICTCIEEAVIGYRVEAFVAWLWVIEVVCLAPAWMKGGLCLEEHVLLRLPRVSELPVYTHKRIIHQGEKGHILAYEV
ncbi:MAG: hypothetical protein MJE68_21460, partial [Proteobacteria bacterium]|nr:hypothetical protein [Pseudomonadota bacterium]